MGFIQISQPYNLLATHAGNGYGLMDKDKNAGSNVGLIHFKINKRTSKSSVNLSNYINLLVPPP